MSSVVGHLLIANLDIWVQRPEPKEKASETNSYNKELKPSNPSALNLYSLAVSVNLELVYFSLKVPIMWLDID